MAEYDFTNYYKQAYLQEKRKNIQLMADAAAKEQEIICLRQKYERIANNPLFRVIRGFKKVPAKLKAGRKTKVKDILCKEDSVSVKQYEKELQFQKNPYAFWISERESGVAFEAEGRGKLVETVFLEECGRDFSVGNGKKPYLLFVSKNGTLHPHAKAIIEEFFEKHEEAALVYAGEDISEQGKTGEEVRKNPWFKPAYSPETLLSFFYFGNIFAIRTEELRGLEWKKAESWKENIYDFVLKAEESLGEKGAESIVFLDKILFHQRIGAEEDKKTFVIDSGAIPGLWGYEKEFAQIKLDALKRRGIEGHTEESNVPGIYSVCVDTEDKVSIVILSKDNTRVLEQCIRSIRERTSYKNYEIIVVDNGSYEANRLKAEALSRTYDFTYVCEPMDFNFSAMCNIGAKKATGKYLLLLNDDMEIIESGYLGRLAGQASVEGVGAVGAKLWYPDSIKIQHAGITNLAIGPGHKLTGCEDDRMYYDGRNYFTFNYLAVTGACLMIRKELYDAVGGMDETLPVAYNDVEFCFRLHKAGYRNVLRNDCILFHHESLSRGTDEESDEKARRLLEERKHLYQKYPSYEGKDEYYSPWLAQDSREYICNGRNGLLETIKPMTELSQENRGKLLAENGIAATFDRIQVTEGKANVYGWSVLLGADNCHYKRSILLEGTENKRLYATELSSYYREDVEKALPDQLRIELAGFRAGFLVKNLESGTYKVGILYEDMLSDKRYYRMLESYIQI